MITRSKKIQLNSWIWHLFVLCGAVFFHSLSLGGIYRACLYLNVLFVLYIYIKRKKEHNVLSFFNIKLFYLAVLMTGMLLIFDMMSTGLLHWSKEINHLVLMIFLCLGVLFQATYNSAFVNKNIKNILTILVILYLAIQLVFIFILHRPFGTLKNPHYLAQYAMLLIPTCIFLFYKSSTTIKLILLFSAAGFVGLLLHTNSRPAWLSIIFAMVVLSFYLKRKLFALSSLAVIILIIWMTNLGNFAEHLTTLFAHLKNEERAYIWRGAWNLQLQSSIKEWVLGHGFHSYESSYSHFGTLELVSVVTYNSPHNFLLEITYSSGLIGLILLLCFYCILYIKLFETFKNAVECKNLTLLLIAILTINLAFVAIIVPIFSSYHLLITAVVCGVLTYIKNQSKATI